MKILKKILSAGMAVVTALTVTGVLRLPELSLSMALTANAANANGSCGASLIWTLDSGGTLTISGTGKMTNWSNKEAPWYKYRDRVKSVKFSNNVESIGNFAFTDCSYLRNVLIPDSVERIGEYAFGLCQNLNDITILNPTCRIYESSATINNSVNPTISGFDFRRGCNNSRKSQPLWTSNKNGFLKSPTPPSPPP